jgi:enamine deaminase RidA (YjgF/YER057c/UK114 family)
MASDIKITVTDRANGVRTASSGSKWEPIMGYSRAVRSGSHIAVTGTVGVNADGTYPKTMGEQTRRSLQIIIAALEALGADVKHVIRTRMFVTDVSKWEEVARVHGEVFADVRPATSILEVAKLIDKDAMIEIEADAIVPEDAFASGTGAGGVGDAGAISKRLRPFFFAR